MTQTYYVDPTQGSNGSGTSVSPFNSLLNAFTAIVTPFATATEDYIINVRTGADTSAASISMTGSGGSARKLRIQVEDSSQQHTGIRGTGYRLSSNPLVIFCSNTNVSVEVAGISAKGHSFDATSTAITCLYENCIGYDTSNIAANWRGGGTATYKNCAGFGATGTNAAGFRALNNGSAGSVTWINCIAVANATYGFVNSVTATAKNCYAGGNTTDAYSGTITRTTCMHSSATSFSNSTGSIAYSTANFTNVTAASEDLHLVSGSALIAAGTGPASDAAVPTTDFEGTVRSGATTDIGFDQFSAGGGGEVLLMGQAIF